MHVKHIYKDEVFVWQWTNLTCSNALYLRSVKNHYQHSLASGSFFLTKSLSLFHPHSLRFDHVGPLPVL